MASDDEAWEPPHHGRTLVTSDVGGNAPFLSVAKLLFELIAAPDCPPKRPSLVHYEQIEQVC